MATMEQIIKENLGPVVISFVVAILGALGWFSKRWIDSIEEAIKERVHKDLCSEKEEAQKQRRISDEDRIKEFVNELRLLEKRFNDHIDKAE